MHGRHSEHGRSVGGVLQYHAKRRPRAILAARHTPTPGSSGFIGACDLRDARSVGRATSIFSIIAPMFHSRRLGSFARDLSVSRSDRDVDRQVQLDQTRLQQRHGQVIAQFNPGEGIGWRSSELLEDNLAGLS